VARDGRLLHAAQCRAEVRFCENVRRTPALRPFKNETSSAMATKLNLKGNWNELKGKFKQKYGQLTDDDLTFAEGKEDEWLGRLQQKLGRSKEDLRNEIEAL
jgi:uncharacterized protein YjbJ (UPF0337 family)